MYTAVLLYKQEETHPNSIPYISLSLGWEANQQELFHKRNFKIFYKLCTSFMLLLLFKDFSI